MDRGAWRAIVHGIAKNQTWLNWLSKHKYFKVRFIFTKYVSRSMYFPNTKIDTNIFCIYWEEAARLLLKHPSSFVQTTLVSANSIRLLIFSFDPFSWEMKIQEAEKVTCENNTVKDTKEAHASWWLKENPENAMKSKEGGCRLALVLQRPGASNSPKWRILWPNAR